MDDKGREPFQARWERLKQHLGEAKDHRVEPLFQFSLTSFLVITAFTGVAIGWIVRQLGSNGVAIVVVVVIILLYVVTLVGGLILYLWFFDLDIGQRSAHQNNSWVRRKISKSRKSKVAGEGSRRQDTR